jgi:hypothetical protein
MRISGNLIETILTGSLPSIIVVFALSFFIPDFKGATVLERIYFLSGILCLTTIITYIQMNYRKIQNLEIDDSVIIGRKKFLNSDILSIHRSFTRSFNIITFEVSQNGIIEEFSVMDKPKLFGIFGPKGSLTLYHLYNYFPDLQDKEV